MTKSRLRVEDFLGNLPLFKKLGRTAIDRLACGIAEIDAPRDTILYRRGEFSSGIYVVVFGQIKLSLEAKRGNEKVVELIGPGGNFGEAAMFLGKPHIVTTETLVDSKLLHVSREAVFGLIRDEADFARRVIECLSNKLYLQIADLESYTLRSGTERVIEYLLSHELVSMLNGSLRVTLPVKKGIIASRLNLTHEHFSRILHNLMAARLIDVDGRTVHISDIGRLRMHCVE
jgi:CRP-like cAMP-binding protein